MSKVGISRKIIKKKCLFRRAFKNTVATLLLSIQQKPGKKNEKIVTQLNNFNYKNN